MKVIVSATNMAIYLIAVVFSEFNLAVVTSIPFLILINYISNYNDGLHNGIMQKNELRKSLDDLKDVIQNKNN